MKILNLIFVISLTFFWFLLCVAGIYVLNRHIGNDVPLQPTREGPSYLNILLLISVPRFLYSMVFMAGLLYIFQTRLFKGLKRQKILITLILGSLIFFALIFPKKILMLPKESPPNTIATFYTYRSGYIGGGLGPSWEDDWAKVYFLTSATKDELTEYYQQLGGSNLNEFIKDTNKGLYDDSYSLRNGGYLQMYDEVSIYDEFSKPTRKYFVGVLKN